MRVLPVVGGLDVVFLVVSALQLDGFARPIGGLFPFADTRRQMRLHVVCMGNARRRFDVLEAMWPAERGPLDPLVVVDQFVMRSGVQWIDANQGLVIRHGGVRSFGKLRAGEPSFL